jgi:hypothetical protein
MIKSRGRGAFNIGSAEANHKRKERIAMSSTNGKTTFGIKCLEEQSRKLHQYMDAMGPTATGYDFAELLLNVLSISGLIPQDDDIPEIAQARQQIGNKSHAVRPRKPSGPAQG